MAFDFAAIPPEITSALVYGGAGAVPLMAAAAAYNNLAAELSSHSDPMGVDHHDADHREWTGAGSAAAAAAAAPIVSWLTTSAAALEQAGAQATASAAAFEVAYVAVVPPSEVIANRALQASLVPMAIIPTVAAEIAALDATYAEYWAQDVAAMTAYQAASAAAGALTPITPMTQFTNPGALGFNTAANANAATSPATQAVF